MTASGEQKSLQDLIDASPNFVDHLYGNRKGSVVRDAVQRQPTEFVLPEFTNWRDEQRAWRETVALYDQSFHMTETYVRGTDAVAFLEAMGVNGFKTFGPERGRHFVACSPSGHLLGDGVLYAHTLEDIALVGRSSGHNWLQYQAEQGSWDVELERNEIYSSNPDGRRTEYRFQVEGPNAFPLLEKLTGTKLPSTVTFDIIPLTIAGRRVAALRHTMAGGTGFELYGPWDEGPEVKQAIISAGADFGLRQVGSLAYFTTAVELGWIPRPMPAVFSGEEMRGFREWLPATADEAIWSLGGSFYSTEVSDYYYTPWDLGYGHLVKFNHDFVGREALEKSQHDEHRRPVTLQWNAEDFGRAYASAAAGPGDLPAKFIDMPRATYATWQYDTVLNAKQQVTGAANYHCLTWNERAMTSLAIVDAADAVPGTELTIVWGEPDGGAKSFPWIEPHAQIEVRATVVDHGGH